MPLRIVQSQQNGRLKQLRRALSRPGSGESGLVAIEGPNLLAEAVRTGLRIATVFVAQGSQRLLDAVELPTETEILLLPPELLAGAMTTETPQPIAALVHPPDWHWEKLWESDESVPLMLVLAGLQDPGNLGTILRSAEAFGATGIVSLPGTVTEWNPKAMRASAGSLFRMPVVRQDPFECIRLLREAGLKIWVADPVGAQAAIDVDLAAGVALIIGNEGNGVPPEIAEKADGAITIPCPGPVESLNAAAAASILLYEASRQRTANATSPHQKRKRSAR
jgi:TrmH family RNA methyltransferase